MSGMIREWEQDENAFQYEERDGKATLLQWKGSGAVAQVPGYAGNAEVAAIGRKAFLSNKRIQEVILPDTVRVIDDWAFAYCSRLSCIHLPRQGIVFGKGAFLQCEKLEQICLERGGLPALPEEDMECVGALLAAAVHKLDDAWLLSPQEAGSAHWIEKWDMRLLKVLRTPDREGYQKTILCGEEDIGSMENNLEYFLEQKRRSKVRLALLRLIYDKGLGAAVREELTEYLLAHTIGCPYEETWRTVKEEYGNRKAYYDVLLDIGALNGENLDTALCDMGTELAEMKAYLLREKEARFGTGGFFDSLSLE